MRTTPFADFKLLNTEITKTETEVCNIPVRDRRTTNEHILNFHRENVYYLFVNGVVCFLQCNPVSPTNKTDHHEVGKY